MCYYYMNLYQCGHQRLDTTPCREKQAIIAKDLQIDCSEPKTPEDDVVVAVQPCGCLHGNILADKYDKVNNLPEWLYHYHWPIKKDAKEFAKVVWGGHDPYRLDQDGKVRFATDAGNRLRAQHKKEEYCLVARFEAEELRKWEEQAAGEQTAF